MVGRFDQVGKVTAFRLHWKLVHHGKVVSDGHHLLAHSSWSDFTRSVLGRSLTDGERLVVLARCGNDYVQKIIAPRLRGRHDEEVHPRSPQAAKLERRRRMEADLRRDCRLAPWGVVPLQRGRGDRPLHEAGYLEEED